MCDKKGFVLGGDGISSQELCYESDNEDCHRVLLQIVDSVLESQSTKIVINMSESQKNEYSENFLEEQTVTCENSQIKEVMLGESKEVANENEEIKEVMLDERKELAVENEEMKEVMIDESKELAVSSGTVVTAKMVSSVEQQSEHLLLDQLNDQNEKIQPLDKEENLVGNNPLLDSEKPVYLFGENIRVICKIQKEFGLKGKNSFLKGCKW